MGFAARAHRETHQKSRTRDGPNLKANHTGSSGFPIGEWQCNPLGTVRRRFPFPALLPKRTNNAIALTMDYPPGVSSDEACADIRNRHR